MDTALFTAKGKLVAHTEEMPLPEALEQQVVVDFAESLAEKQTYQDYHLYKVMVEGETEYILVCLVKEESFLVCAQMAVCQIRNLVMSFAEQFDRNNFMQNIILGNMLIVDIYGKAKKHHIQEVPRVVFVIDTGSKKSCRYPFEGLCDLRGSAQYRSDQRCFPYKRRGDGGTSVKNCGKPCR